MKAERSRLMQYNDRYGYGILQFKGPWKTVIGEYGDTTQLALALEVFTVDGEVYSYPVEGYYDNVFGPTWNADTTAANTSPAPSSPSKAPTVPNSATCTAPPRASPWDSSPSAAANSPCAATKSTTPSTTNTCPRGKNEN